MILKNRKVVLWFLDYENGCNNKNIIQKQLCLFFQYYESLMDKVYFLFNIECD